jgi:hypothetical protein
MRIRCSQGHFPSVDPRLALAKAECHVAAGDGTGKEKVMPLMQLVIVLIVVGVLLWLVNNFIPMARSIKSILNAVVVIVVVLWLLQVFGVLPAMSTIRVG